MLPALTPTLFTASTHWTTLSRPRPAQMCTVGHSAVNSHSPKDQRQSAKCVQLLAVYEQAIGFFFSAKAYYTDRLQGFDHKTEKSPFVQLSQKIGPVP